MSDRYRLVALGNHQLLAALKVLFHKEHGLLSDLLAHLAEVDERRLYLDLGYTSLFAYCTEALGFCKSSAGRRIAAARACRKHPEAFVRVASGDLQLSALCLLAQYSNRENAAELFAACRRKSYEQVELLLAARFPKPDVRDLIRRLPVKSEASSASAPDMGDMGSASCSSNLMAPRATPFDSKAGSFTEDLPARAPATPAPRLEPLSPDRFGVHFTADTEFRARLEEVRALCSHRQPQGELLPLMKRALEAYRTKLRKDRFGVRRKPRRGAPNGRTKESRARSRHVPAAVAREVYERDGGSCSIVSDDGRRCGTTQFLEVDHRKPWAEGGPPTPDNLRLRCRAHNQHAAREHFGDQHIDEAIAGARAKRSSGSDMPL